MNFLTGSFKIGKLFGINIRIHILFVLWIAFRLFYAGTDMRWTLFFLSMLFGIILLHELGHCFGARAVGGDARDIMMWPLGGLAFAHAPMRPWPQFVTVAAGPLVNVVLCLLSALAIFIVTNGGILPGINPLHPSYHIVGDNPTLPSSFLYLRVFYYVNLWLLAFNLLPIYPLDGGQLFHAIIWPFVGIHRATQIACYVGIGGAAMLAAWGIQGQGEGILIFIAIFGGLTCLQRLQMLRHGMIAEDSGYETYDYLGRYSRKRSAWTRVWRRLFKTRDADAPHPQSPAGGRSSPNPNPGAWQHHMDERAKEEAELDRILKKVSEQGIHSLSYIERQTLERVTRRRQAEERDFQRDTRL